MPKKTRPGRRRNEKRRAAAAEKQRPLTASEQESRRLANERGDGGFWTAAKLREWVLSQRAYRPDVARHPDEPQETTA